jgi:hypothetical protein
MMIIAGFIAFDILCWLYIACKLRKAPTDIELWGEEIG